MSLKCNLGFHSWDRCKCSVCGKTRDEQHNWSANCEKCSICGKTREKQHKWGKWDSDCKCSICGKIRDEHHSWHINCEKCSKCGKRRENQHDWTTDCEKCSKCGTTLPNKHDWLTNSERCSRCGKTYSEVIADSLNQNGANYELILSKITDQKIFAKIACTNKHRRIIQMAINKIDDQSLLKSIVFSAHEDFAGELAVEKIKDVKVLTEICDFALGNHEDGIKINLSTRTMNLIIAANDFDPSLVEKLKVMLPKIHDLCSTEDTSHGGITYYQFYSEWITAAKAILESVD
jgi:hypothetical protein